jgi:dienelactone hydrolase
VHLVDYRSCRTPLAAFWCLPANVEPGSTRAAVIFHCAGDRLNDDVTLDALDVEDMRAFLDAGYIVMTPTYRGQGDNPGPWEPVNGPGEDALAAAGWARERPEARPFNIFHVGRGVGANIALYAARLSSELEVCGAVALLPADGRPAVLTADLYTPPTAANDRARAPAVRGPPVHFALPVLLLDWRRPSTGAVDPPHVHGRRTDGSAEDPAVRRRGLQPALSFLAARCRGENFDAAAAR